jgi:predicted nucleotidyltransferase
MERYSGTKNLTSAWTFDHIQHRDIIASVRDPYLIHTESGRDMVPATISYRRDAIGTRKSPLFVDRYKKVLYEYSHAKLFTDNAEVIDYLVYDDDAEAMIVAIPMDEESRIISARERTLDLIDGDTQESSIVASLMKIFPNQTFGVFGSRSLGLNDASSDLDLFIYGSAGYKQVVLQLKDIMLQKELGIEPISGDEQIKNAKRFAGKYDIPFEQALRISSLRNRYVLNPAGINPIHIAFTASMGQDEKNFKTILGSKKIAKVSEVGITTSADYASTFPRVYRVEIDGQTIDVISMHWSFRNMTEEDDRIRIKGTLRTKDGVSFISLEDSEDYILAASN